MFLKLNSNTWEWSVTIVDTIWMVTRRFPASSLNVSEHGFRCYPILFIAYKNKNTTIMWRNARVNQEIITAVKHFGVTNLASIFDSLSNCLYLLPIFLYVNGPFPLEMLVFVIIGEERLDSIGSTPQSSRWCILQWSLIRMGFQLGSIWSNHMGHFVNRNA